MICGVCKSDKVNKTVVGIGFMSTLYQYLCECGWKKLINVSHQLKRRRYAYYKKVRKD